MTVDTLRKILWDAKYAKLCTRIPCTTCGSKGFRGRLQGVGEENIVREIGDLTDGDLLEYYGPLNDVFKWLRYECYVRTPEDIGEIKGTPAWREFERLFVKHQTAVELKRSNRIAEEAKQEEFRKIKQAKASFDLLGAVKRGDEKAVRALLARGADPDFERGAGIDTTRQTALRLGRELWLSSPNEANQQK